VTVGRQLPTRHRAATVTTSKEDVMLRRKPRIGDVVRIGNPPVVVIATTRKRRGRRVEIIQEISAPGLPV
jgi:hypothetical protein